MLRLGFIGLVLAMPDGGGLQVPEFSPSQLCGTQCYCVETTKPKVCFCAQPAPQDGTVFVFTPNIKVYSPDGGSYEVRP